MSVRKFTMISAIVVFMTLAANVDRIEAYRYGEDWADVQYYEVPELVIDPRVNFDGGSCPTGYIRFYGKCVKKKGFVD
jgi:hypothetical protein